MPSVARVLASSLAALAALLAMSLPVAAAPKRVTGKLTKPGYTVIALAADGRARVVRADSGRFNVRPPANRVTLQLRAPNGGYAGPIVVGRLGTRAIVGVRSGARLGEVKVVARRGYAKTSKQLRGKWLDTDRVARAKKGIPIGALVFGRVRSKPPRNSISADSDVDGVPETIDIDDDGDLILDAFERRGATRAAQAVGSPLDIAANLTFSIEQTVNANSAALTVDVIDAALSQYGWLNFGPLCGRPRCLPGTAPGDPAELDCGGEPDPGNADGWSGGLSYCTRGGTGTVMTAEAPPFPGPAGGSFDPDGDGFGTLTPLPPAPFFGLQHGAETAKFDSLGRRLPGGVGTGDILIPRFTEDGVETASPYTLGFVFATVPTLVSYDDGQGNSAEVSCPSPTVPDWCYPQPGPGGPGTAGSPFPVAARTAPCADPAFCAAGDVVLTFTFWRPQRRPIGAGPDREACLNDTPPCEWIDIGRALYTATVQGGSVACTEQSDFETRDPSLTPLGGGNLGAGFTDGARDRPASPSNTFTYTLNVTRCLGSQGGSWNSGTRSFAFKAFDRGGAGYAEQMVWFGRQ